MWSWVIPENPLNPVFVELKLFLKQQIKTKIGHRLLGLGKKSTKSLMCGLNGSAEGAT